MHTLRELTETLHTHGDAPVVVAYGAEDATVWSYAELAARMEQTSRWLTQEGLSRGEHVAILAPTGFPWFVAALALLHVGAVVVPIDTQLGDEEVDRILADSGAMLAFAGPRDMRRLEQMDFGRRGRILDIESVVTRDAAEAGEDGWPDTSDMPTPAAGDRAVLFYTSGTTGPAKGVPLTHGNLAFQVGTIRREEILQPDDRLLLPLPTHHVYPFVIGILVPLSYAIPIVLPFSRTGPELVRALHDGGVTALLGVPRLYRALVEALEDRVASRSRIAGAALRGGLTASWHMARLGLQRGKLLFGPLHRQFGPKLRLMASGGAPLDAELERRLTGLGWEIAIGYGLTETSPLLTMRLPGEIAPGTVGRAVEGIDLRIDTESAPDAAPGPEGAGEVQARGPSVFSGYHEMPEKTAETFTEDGWFRTGDLGYFDDEGRLVLLGRVSTLLVTEGGENVQPTEVEEHYAEHRAIREIGVLERDGRLVAVVVPEPRELLADEEPEGAAREGVRERSEALPSYQRIADVAITSEPLPRTRLDDLRRHLIEERYDRALAEEDPTDREPMAISEMPPADRELLEDPVAREVWALIVERYPDRRVTPDTSPRVGLGIDSLGWVDLTLEIERRTGVQLSEQAVQRVESVRDLMEEAAEAAESLEGESRPSRDRVVAPLENPEDVLTVEEREWLEPLSGMEPIASAAAFALVDKMMRLVFRLCVEGLHHLPEGPVLYTPNHVSYLDPFAVASALPVERRKNTQWAGSRNVMFGNAAARTIARLAWTVPVEPGRAATSSLALGAAALRRDRSLVWFPEGRRSPDAELGPFTTGIGRLLDAIDVPVVPVYLIGTEKALPMHAFWPRPNEPVRVRFGPAVRAEQLASEGSGEGRAERIADGLRARVKQLQNG